MSSYLSNIATRTSGKDARILLPPTPIISAANHGINLYSDDFNTSQEINGQNQFENESMSPVQPGQTEKIFRSGVSAWMGTHATEQNNEPSYFSKYAERLGSLERSHIGKANSTEPGNFRIVQPSLQTHEEKTASSDSEKIEAFFEKDGPQGITETIISKELSNLKRTIKPEDTVQNGFIIRKPDHFDAQLTMVNPEDAIKTIKQKMQPYVGEEKDKSKKRPSGNQIIEPASRSRLNIENNGKVQRTVYNTPPRLVIGKIIIEILPPPASAPPKVVTRVLQSSPQEGHPRSNKLIFGLGQL